MTMQEPTAAPDRFIRLLDKSIEEQGLSLREVARRAGVSIAYISRLLNKQRGLPADKTITRFEKALDITPGRLFDAAKRHDALAAKFFKNDKMRSLLQSFEAATEEEVDRFLTEAERLAKKHHPEEQ